MNAEADIVSRVPFDFSGGFGKVGKHLSKVQASAGIRMFPVRFVAVMGQQETAGLRCPVAKVLPDQLLSSSAVLTAK